MRDGRRHAGPPGKVPQGLGYIFQKDTVLPWLSVGDNIGLGFVTATGREPRSNAR